MYLSNIKQTGKIATLIVLLLMSLSITAQTIIVGNPLRKKRFVFHTGDEISFKVEGTRHLFSGNIQKLSPRHLFLHKEPIAYTSIRKLVFPDRLKYLRYMGFTLLGSSAISFTISGLVRLTDNKSFSDKDQWIVFGILSGIGVSLTPFKDRHYYINGGRKIRYTDL